MKKQLTRNQFPLLLFLSLSMSFVTSTFAGAFKYDTTYHRNKKIWGTYKLGSHELHFNNGKKTHKKVPAARVGDIILSDGHFIFIRETLHDGKTHIVVDKIAYKKIGKHQFTNKNKLQKEKLDRLFKYDLIGHLPSEGNISYNNISCLNKRGTIRCSLEGEIKN